MRPFSAERLWDPVVQKRIKTFDRKIKHFWKLDDEDDIHQATPAFPAFDPDIVLQENDKELGLIPEGPPDPNYFTLEEYDKYVSEHLKILLGDKEVFTTVKRCKRDINGIPIGISNDNPLLDMKLYKVQLPDGAVEE